MQRHRLQRVATGLATLYSVCALAGYGLHVLSGGGFHGCDASCYDHANSGVVAATHGPASELDANLDVSELGAVEATFSAAQAEQDVEQCLVCLLLAQIRVGHAQLAETVATSPYAVSPAPVIDAVFSTPALRLADARGPPSTGIAS